MFVDTRPTFGRNRAQHFLDHNFQVLSLEPLKTLVSGIAFAEAEILVDLQKLHGTSIPLARRLRVSTWAAHLVFRVGTTPRFCWFPQGRPGKTTCCCFFFGGGLLKCVKALQLFGLPDFWTAVEVDSNGSLPKLLPLFVWLFDHGSSDFNLLGSGFPLSDLQKEQVFCTGVMANKIGETGLRA